MFRNALFASTALLLALAAPSAWALDASFHYKAGYDTGGDTLVTVTFTSGETESIKANRGLFFGAGVSLINDARDIETEISLSYKIDDITAENGDITWSRWPLDVLVFYRLPAFRVGGGVTHHFAPDLDGSGVVGGLNVEFENATGFILQADYRLNEKMNLGLRYTMLEYETEGGSGPIKSNGIGLVFSGSL